MKQEEMRQKLIDGTILVVANEGLGETTTKKVRMACSINEAYIYRCFRSKEDMLAKTFSYLDEELFSVAMKFLDDVDLSQICVERWSREYFNAMWTFLLGNREKCLAYMQLYYSPYFVKCSVDEHKTRFLPLVERFRPAFKEGGRRVDDPEPHFECVAGFCSEGA